MKYADTATSDSAQQIEVLAGQLERATEILDAARQAGNRMAAVLAHLNVIGIRMQLDELRRQVRQ